MLITDLSHDPAILGINQEKKKMSTQTSTVFTVPLFTIVKKWKKPRCASTDEWANEILPAMEYYLALKRKKVLIHASGQIDLENIILSDRSSHIPHIPHTTKTSYTT